MGSKLSREEEELESLKTECNDAGCKIQSLQAQTESIRALVRTYCAVRSRRGGGVVGGVNCFKAGTPPNTPVLKD